VDKRFIGIIIAIIIVIAGIVFFSDRGNSNDSKSTNTNKAALTHHVEGQGKAGLKLVEYGDYECPFCAEYYPVVKQVASIYHKQIKFQFRNFPLTQIHKNAFAAARAAEAASLQGKFWQMHDLLYENSSYEQQTGWVVSSNPLKDYFVGYAKQLKLNVSKFKNDYSSGKVNNRINADKSKGVDLGVQATPWFLLNGKHVQPNISVSSFEKIVNKALKKKGVTPPADAQPAANSSGKPAGQTKAKSSSRAKSQTKAKQ
jgi:protein-disulfide isomerase